MDKIQKIVEHVEKLQCQLKIAQEKLVAATTMNNKIENELYELEDWVRLNKIWKTLLFSKQIDIDIDFFSHDCFENWFQYEDGDGVLLAKEIRNIIEKVPHIINYRDFDGRTLISYYFIAATCNYEDIRFFIENGAKLSDECRSVMHCPPSCKDDKDDEKLINFYIANNYDVNIKDDHGVPALFSSLFNLNWTKLLLKNGADIFITDNEGSSIFHYICRKYYCEHIKVLNLILTYRKDVNFKNNFGETPLFTLFHEKSIYEKQGQLEIFQEFIKNGADINVRNNKGETIIHQIVFKL